MQQYQIKYSRLLKAFNLSLYLLVIFTILVFVDEIWMAAPLALLTMLLMLSDYLSWQTANLKAPTALTLYPERGEIEIQQADCHERFNGYRLYLNRWFVILRLCDRGVSRNFLLIGDSFESTIEYLNFRHQILKMSRDQYAA
ncbi:MAG: hypothetical protein ACC663_00355 [Gammaproteobacteria bacterium]